MAVVELATECGMGRFVPQATPGLLCAAEEWK
jgi:hypothetical protein